MESVTTAIANISSQQKQDIADSTPDDPQYLVGWRRGLEKALKEGMARSLEFLLKNPPTEQAALQQALLALIRRSHRRTESLAAPPSPDTIRAHIDSAVGFSITEHLNHQKQLMELYSSTVVELSSAEQKLAQKMEQLTKIHDTVIRLQSIDTPVGLDRLQEPVEQYL